MGLYDDVTINKTFPDYGIPEGMMFQTKSLYAGMAKFTITAEGTLVEHIFRYQNAVVPNDTLALSFLGKPIHVEDRAIDYHDDILLTPTRSDGEEMVARFTHGRLESLRPLSSYPEKNRSLLLEQGAR